jgi:hypothetical protein
MAMVETTNALPFTSLPSSPVTVERDAYIVRTLMFLCTGGVKSEDSRECSSSQVRGLPIFSSLQGV